MQLNCLPALAALAACVCADTANESFLEDKSNLAKVLSVLYNQRAEVMPLSTKSTATSTATSTSKASTSASSTVTTTKSSTSTLSSTKTSSSSKSTSKTSSSTSTSASASSTSIFSSSGALKKSVLGYSYSGFGAVDIKSEGESVIDKFFTRFYKDGKFVGDTVCGGGGDTTVVWPVAVVMQAVVDAERVENGKYTQKISTVYDVLDKYYNSNKKGCSASMNKDNDIYYDDNAQIASAMITAYEVTKTQKYLTRGSDIVDFLMAGWNDTTGGVTWHLGSPYVATISTTESALAALRLYANTGKSNSKLTDFAAKCMKFLHSKMLDSSTGLLYDGVTGTNIDKAHYSYHTGTALSACTMLYEFTKDEFWKNWAYELSVVATSRGLEIYNRDYDDKYRFWRDELDFTQLVTQGLIDYYSYNKTAIYARNEIIRETRFVHDFAKGSDGLYFRTVDARSNSQTLFARWKEATSTDKGASIDTGYYCSKDTTKSAKRDVIVQASAAIMYFLTASLSSRL